MMRVGLLGTGRIGSLHAETIAAHPASVLHSVSDIDSDSAKILAANIMLMQNQQTKLFQIQTLMQF